MPSVTSTEKDPAGNAHRNALVRVKLVATLVGAAPGYVPSGNYSILGEYTTRTDSGGVWTVTLTANELISPENTFYIADVQPTVGQAIRHIFDVPDGAGPYRVEDRLTDPPANLPTLLSEELAEHIAATAVALAGKAPLADFTALETLVGEPGTADANSIYYKLLEIAMGYHVVGGSRYPATPNGASGTAKAGVLAAVAGALAQPRGGTVYFPAAIWDAGDAEILWPEFTATGKQLVLKGDGDKTSVLKRSVDGPLGSHFIAGDYDGGALRSDQGGLYKNTIRDMRIIGPGTRGAIGTSPADMGGVMLDTHVCLYNVDISLFRDGINVAGNHNDLYTCTLGNNYYGAYHTVTPGNGGSTVFYTCNLAGNLHSSHAIAPTALASFVMIEGHNGFNPYGVFMEAGRVAGSVAMIQSTFYSTNWEYLGNAFIWSADQNAAINECTFIRNANFSENNATYGLPASAYTSHIRLHTMTRCDFPQTDLAGAPTESYIDVSTSLTQVSFDGYGRNMVTNSLARGVPLVLGPAGGNQMGVILKDFSYAAEAVPADSSAAIVADRLVEWTQFRTVRPHGQWGAGARTPVAGVAVNSVSASSRTYALVIQEGNDVLVDIDGPEPTATQVLVPSSTTPSKAMATSWDGTTATVSRPIIGAFYLAGAPAGKTKARVDIR